MKRVFSVLFFLIIAFSFEVVFVFAQENGSEESYRKRDIFRPLKEEPNELVIIVKKDSEPQISLGNTKIEEGKRIGPVHYFSYEDNEIVLNIRGIICKIKVQGDKQETGDNNDD